MKAAIRFLRANATAYGIDPTAVAVWGQSAGGYLVAMVGATNGAVEPVAMRLFAIEPEAKLLCGLSEESGHWLGL